MLERSVACSDLSSLHSYFSTGIVRLMSPLHNRCHLSVRLRAVQNLRGFSGYDCKTEQGTDVGNSFFRQAFDTLSKARQGRVGRTNGDNCLSFIEKKNQSGTRKWLISSYLLPLLRRHLLGSFRFFHPMPGGLIVPSKRV